MGQHITLPQVFKSLFGQAELASILKKYGYRDTARKFTVLELLKFFVAAAVGEWESYRESEEQLAGRSDIVRSDHSTLSKKAKELPYFISKEVFHRLISKCNRKTRRLLKLPVTLYADDSTSVTVGEGRLPWAAFHGKRSGIKLHFRFDIGNRMPCRAEESTAREHDSRMAEKLLPDEPEGIDVWDPAYFDLKRLDSWDQAGRWFVMRIRSNTVLSNPKALRRWPVDDSNVVEDVTAVLGCEAKQTQRRFRVVTFLDSKGNFIRVATNLVFLSAETIAAIYKERWQIELFFRWIKQHLNVKRLFGTSPNAVYNQLYGALIAYVLLRWLYQEAKPTWRCVNLSFTDFLRKLRLGQLPTEVAYSLVQLLSTRRCLLLNIG